MIIDTIYWVNGAPAMDGREEAVGHLVGDEHAALGARRERARERRAARRLALHAANARTSLLSCALVLEHIVRAHCTPTRIISTSRRWGAESPLKSSTLVIVIVFIVAPAE